MLVAQDISLSSGRQVYLNESSKVVLNCQWFNENHQRKLAIFVSCGGPSPRCLQTSEVCRRNFQPLETFAAEFADLFSRSPSPFHEDASSFACVATGLPVLFFSSFLAHFQVLKTYLD